MSPSSSTEHSEHAHLQSANQGQNAFEALSHWEIADERKVRI